MKEVLEAIKAQEEVLSRIEKKLDLILNTFGLRETLQRESAHKVNRLINMPVEDVKREMKEAARQARRQRY